MNERIDHRLQTRLINRFEWAHDRERFITNIKRDAHRATMAWHAMGRAFAKAGHVSTGRDIERCAAVSPGFDSAVSAWLQAA